MESSLDEQMKDQQASCDNVMEIFSSFQQTFNTEQDIREVYALCYDAVLMLSADSCDSFVIGYTKILIRSVCTAFTLFDHRTSAQLLESWSRLHVAYTLVCKGYTILSLMMVSKLDNNIKH